MDILDEFMGRFQQQANAPIKPVKFLDQEQDNKIKPIYFLNDHPNDPTKFAILSTTEGGKYVRGGMLFFSFNGIEIYTELKNAIFVNTIDRTVFIKEYDQVQKEINPTDPEDRQYILMMKCYEDDKDYYTWESMTGRSTCYEYIVNNIEDMCIDPEESFVLVENVPYKDALSIANFVRYLKNAELVQEDGFDIEEYILT